MDLDLCRAAFAVAEEGVCEDAVCLLQTQQFMQKSAAQQQHRAATTPSRLMGSWLLTVLL